MTQLAPFDPAIEITVCIVNWNGSRWIRDCLRSLHEPGTPSLEIIFVDNASTDNSVEMVRAEFPQTRVIVNSSNVGFAQANNQAILCGRGVYFFILNNDTIVHNHTIARLVRFLNQHLKAGMVAGHLVNPDGSTQFGYYPVALPTLGSLAADLLWLNRFWPRNRLGRGALARNWDPDKPSRMEQIPGACIMARREFFEQVGLFDETYGFWYEDVDLCARSLRAGWEMWYLPEARITHYGAASTKLMDVSSRSLLRFRNMMRYSRKYFRPSHSFLLKITVGLVLVARLPIVLAASLWPKAQVRRIWKGTWRAYVQLLGEIVHG
ncbi:MAG TPA: glycosyltransferase family 2 protein [Terriglobia bacterium]|nr:glycosyltransferase family 2 protein [Terriglobia bacterium]